MTEKNISSDDNIRIPSSRRIFAKNLAKLSKLKLENNIKKRGLKRSYILLIPLMFVSVSIIWWLNFAEKNGNIELNIEQVSQSQDANTEMTGARFASRTSDGENFEINAQKAIDNTPEPGLIYLSNPNGTIWTKKGNMIEITSMEAILDQSKEFTLFKGSVKMQQDVPKTEINASVLSIDLINKIYESSQPVHVSTENITIRGKNMSVNGEKGTISFGGHVKLTFNDDK